MPAHPQVIHQTSEEFAQRVRDFNERLRADPGFAELMAVVCGGPERLQVFTHHSGVSMSRFATLTGLPASTVRHYQRLGLITPYRVNGKFRFWVHNLIQVESVRQWRDLGLNLENIRSQRSHERLGGQSVPFNALTADGLSALVTEKAVRIGVPEMLGTALPKNSLNAETVWLPLQEERRRVASREVLRSGVPEVNGEPLNSVRLLAEVRVARAQLEQQLHLLTARVEQARRLETALEQAQER